MSSSDRHVETEHGKMLEEAIIDYFGEAAPAKDSEEWHQAEDSFENGDLQHVWSDYIEVCRSREEYLREVAEAKWISENPQSSRYGRCNADLLTLKKELCPPQQNASFTLDIEREVLNKSFYSYAVSIMEAFCVIQQKPLLSIAIQ